MLHYQINDVILNAVRLEPSVLQMKVGDTQHISTVYDPMDYPNQNGQWTYDPEYIDRINETATVFVFKAKKPGTTPIAYAPDDNPSLVAYSKIIISQTELKSISLSPTYEVVKKGQQFDIAISYDPNEAAHNGNWTYDNTVVRLMEESTPDLARFEVISATPQSIPLTYSSGTVSCTNMCTILNTPAQEVKLNPTEEYVNVGKDFFIDVTYIPDNADKVGVWKYDNTRLVLLSDTDSTTKAHFVAIKESTVGGIDLTFISGTATASNTCYISSHTLESLDLSPNKETVSKGHTFKIDIIYNPNEANHIGTWDYNKEFLRYEDESTVDTAYFTVLQDSSDPLILTYTSADKIATNTCTVSPYDILQEIHLDPDTETVKVGDTFEIGISYVPDSAPHMGMWMYDPDIFEQDEDNSTPEKGIFKVISQPKSIQRLIYGANKVKATNICQVEQDDLQVIVLTPDSETVNVGDSFTVNVTYVPDTAQHNAHWVYDTSLFKMTNFTPEQATFLVLASSDEPAKLICSSGNVSATNTCTINNPTPDLKSVTLFPKSETVGVGDSFEIQITYEPDNAIHQGTWDYDDALFELSSDSTPDNAIFKVIALFADDQKLTYSSGSVSDTNICTKKPDDLQSIMINPAMANMLVGYPKTFYVQFTPDTASHEGEWWYDKKIFDLVSNDSTSDAIILQAKTTTGSTTTPVVFIPKANQQLAKGSVVKVQ